jgi:hypothetical protein
MSLISNQFDDFIKVAFGRYYGDRISQSPFESMLSRVRRVGEAFKLIDQFRVRSFSAVFYR